MNLADILSDESLRLSEFPVAREQIFMAHAGVTVLPRCVARAMQEYQRVRQILASAKPPETTKTT